MQQKGEREDLAAADSKHPKYSKEDLKDLNVALVHYWLVTWRGGEKVLESLLKIFPKADIYTLFYDKQTCSPYVGDRDVYSSKLDLPWLKFKYQKLFPLYPFAVNSLTLQKKYDLIISSESGPAKGIRNPSKTPHLCYIHSPMRYCWGFTDMYLESLPKWTRPFAGRQFKKLRDWDLTTVNNVDTYLSNSDNVKNRVAHYYNRDATTCYPPIALDLFENELQKEKGEYYLSFGAITPYKAIDLLIEAFNKLDKPLVVIGDGSERKKLQSIANSNIRFLGALPDKDVQKHIKKAKALLYPGEEDFGMIPLEVMSQGVPVLAYGKGGALETVVENKQEISKSSGLFFNEQTTEALLEVIEEFETVEDQFNPLWIRNHARLFGEDHFIKNISGHIVDFLNNA